MLKFSKNKDSANHLGVKRNFDGVMWRHCDVALKITLLCAVKVWCPKGLSPRMNGIQNQTIVHMHGTITHLSPVIYSLPRGEISILVYPDLLDKAGFHVIATSLCVLHVTTISLRLTPFFIFDIINSLQSSTFYSKMIKNDNFPPCFSIPKGT